MAKPQRRILAKHEVAQRLGVGRTTVYRMVKDGEIPYVQIGGRRYIYEDLLEEWIQKQTHKPKAES